MRREQPKIRAMRYLLISFAVLLGACASDGLTSAQRAVIERMPEDSRPTLETVARFENGEDVPGSFSTPGAGKWPGMFQGRVVLRYLPADETARLGLFRIAVDGGYCAGPFKYPPDSEFGEWQLRCYPSGAEATGGVWTYDGRMHVRGTDRSGRKIAVTFPTRENHTAH